MWMCENCELPSEQEPARGGHVDYMTPDGYQLPPLEVLEFDCLWCGWATIYEFKATIYGYV